MASQSGRARIGISGWRYAPWRHVFYPKGLPQHREPLVDLGNRLRRQPAGSLGALDAAEDKSRSLQHLEMTRDGGLGQVERFDQFHDRRFPQCEASKDRPACWISQRGESRIKVWHMLNPLYK